MPLSKVPTISERETNALLAKAMNKLSVREREQVYQDVHGISKTVKETDEMIQDHLEQMAHEIESASEHSKHGYHIAMKMDAEWTTSRRILLMFLRCCHFDVPESTRRFLAHLDYKVKYYGADRVAKDITQSDLDEDDLACLRNSHVQLLPQRDQGGRAIVFISVINERYKYVRNHLKAIDYIVWKALQDEETQRKGMVIIPYAVGDLAKMEKKFEPQVVIQGFAKMRSSAARIVAVHHCFGSAAFRPVTMLARKVCADHMHVRIRDHVGSHLEVRYQLMTYGIPTSTIPITIDGTLNTTRHLEWVDTQRQLEESAMQEHRLIKVEDAASIQTTTSHNSEGSSSHHSPQPRRASLASNIIVPTKADVLYGRSNAGHAGNLRLNTMIDERREVYDSSSKHEKTKITSSLVANIKSISGRFLKFDAGAWIEVEDEDARKKVAQTFRSHRRIPTVKQNGGDALERKKAARQNAGGANRAKTKRERARKRAVNENNSERGTSRTRGKRIAVRIDDHYDDSDRGMASSTQENLGLGFDATGEDSWLDDLGQPPLGGDLDISVFNI